MGAIARLLLAYFFTQTDTARDRPRGCYRSCSQADMSTDNDDDAPRIALLTLYAPRHALLRFDVAPFACGYVLCLALFFAVPSREVSANVAMPLLVCAHLLVFLVSHWSLSVLCALKLRRVSTVASATLIHVVPATAGAGLATPPSELCALVRRPRYSPEATAGAAASAEETRFEFHKTAFVLHAKGEGGAKADAEAEAEGVRAGDGLFVQLRMPVGREAAFYLQARGYRDAASVAAAEYVFGANACHIPERSFVWHAGLQPLDRQTGSQAGRLLTRVRRALDRWTSSRSRPSPPSSSSRWCA